MVHRQEMRGLLVLLLQVGLAVGSFKTLRVRHTLQGKTGTTNGPKIPAEVLSSDATGSLQYPRIFVYDSKPSWRVYKNFWKGMSEDDVPCQGDECIYGIKQPISVDGKSWNTRIPGQFWNGRMYHHRLVNSYPHIVTDPSEADLFYVPAFTEWSSFHPEDGDVCYNATEVRESLIHYNASTAHRHFAISPRVSSGDQCPLDLDHGLQWLSLEDLQYGSKISIPYPTALSGMTPSEAHEFLSAVYHVKREHLVAAQFGFHGRTATLRQSLIAECLKDPQCANCGELVSRDAGCYVKQYTDSTFCLNPVGDTPSRKGMIDSLVAGCIPVLYSESQLVMWTNHVGDWRDIAVILPEEQWNNTFSVLRAIPEEEIKTLQRNIHNINYRLSVYREPEASEADQVHEADACDVSMATLWAEVRQSESECVGSLGGTCLPTIHKRMTHTHHSSKKH